MTGKFGSILLILCMAGATLPVAAQEAAVAPQAGVSGTAPPAGAPDGRSLRELRKDLRKAQDRFNALYNKLNPDRDQHVLCEDSADTGSRLAKRRCATAGARSASAQDVMDYMAAANQSAALAGQRLGVDTGQSSSPLQVATDASAPRFVPTDTAITVGNKAPDADARGEAYRNLVKLAAEHPDLRQAMEEYAEAHRRYEAAERRK